MGQCVGHQGGRDRGAEALAARGRQGGDGDDLRDIAVRAQRADGDRPPSSSEAIAVTLNPARMRSRTAASVSEEISAASRAAWPSTPTAVPGARKPTCSTASATGSAASSAASSRTRASAAVGGSSRISSGTAITGRVIAARSDGAVSCTH